MSRRAAGGPDGIVVVDKPSGWTSHDVVARSRSLLGTRKVGHSGTLDPAATGVLVLGVGRATRLLRYLTPLPKSYDATIRFGSETSTLDAEGEVTAVYDMSALDPDSVLSAARRFVGSIEQVPPMVSAVKVGGRRLHELARAGLEVDRASRSVTVTRFDLTPTGDPLLWEAQVNCSSGTYVRSLAADLGKAVGGGAHIETLRRTAVGGFGLDAAIPLEAVGPDQVRPLADAVGSLPSLTVSAELAAAVGVGRPLDADTLGIPSVPRGPEAPDAPASWAVFGPDAELLAVYEWYRPPLLKPAVVLVGRPADEVPSRP